MEGNRTMAKAKSKPKPKSPFLGRWHIVSMSNWDENYFNEEVQAYIEFEPDQRGEFQFGYVRASLTTGKESVTANPPSSGPGTETTRWTRPRGGAGPCWRTTNSTA